MAAMSSFWIITPTFETPLDALIVGASNRR
jgi:hypothetical protein